MLPKSSYFEGQTEDPNTYFSGATRLRLPERYRNRNALGWTQVPALLPSICRSGFRTCKLLRPRPNPVTPQGIGNGSYYTRRRALISVISLESRFTTNQDCASPARKEEMFYRFKVPRPRKQIRWVSRVLEAPAFLDPAPLSMCNAHQSEQNAAVQEYCVEGTNNFHRKFQHRLGQKLPTLFDPCCIGDYPCRYEKH